MIPEETTPSEAQNPDSPTSEATVVPPEPEQTGGPAPSPAKRTTGIKPYNRQYDNGRAISLLVNGAVFLLYCISLIASFASQSTPGDTGYFKNSYIWFGLIGILVNIIIIGTLAAVRSNANENREFVKGFVEGYAVIFFITLVAGVFLSAVCLSLEI